jgi:hypothetical protein
LPRAAASATLATSSTETGIARGANMPVCTRSAWCPICLYLCGASVCLTWSWLAKSSHQTIAQHQLQRPTNHQGVRHAHHSRSDKKYLPTISRFNYRNNARRYNELGRKWKQ